MYFKEVTYAENDKFSCMHKKGHIFQSSKWINVKSNWNAVCIGGFDNNDCMILSCVILFRKIPLTNSFMGYIPRGFVCDYLNEQLIKSFIDYLKKFAAEKKIAFITMDPDVPLSTNRNESKDGEIILNIFKECGLICKESVNFEQIQARHVFRVKFPDKKDDIDQIKKDVFNSFSDKTRYNIRVAERRGLEVETFDKTTMTDKQLDIFYDLMMQTSKRDSFISRKRPYFQNLMNALYPNAKLYLVKYNPKIDLKDTSEKLVNLSNEIDKAVAMKDKLEKSSDCASEQKIKKAERTIKRISELKTQIISLKKRYQEISSYNDKDDIYLAGAIYGFYDRKGWYLYGASADYLRNTMPNYLMQWKMICDSIDNDCIFYDLRGVPGVLNPNNSIYGLYNFKKGFGGDYEEFIGEFDLVIDKFIYTIYAKGFPKFRDIRDGIMKITGSFIS